MNFLNPFFLIGLLAVAIPILIHLINLHRPQKVYFSTLTFFQTLKKSTIRRIRIKQYLLMALRAVAVLMLALALARPFLPPAISGSPGGSSEEPKAIVVMVDNSPSMARIGVEGPLIEQAKVIAATVIDGARPDDRFIVTTTNGSPDVPSLTGSLRAKELIGEVETSNTGNYTAEMFGLLFQQLRQIPFKEAVIYVITDGQQSQFTGLEELKNSTRKVNKPVSLQMVRLKGAEQQNLAITSLALESQMLSKDAPFSIGVEVTNVGEAAASNQFVSLETGDRMVGQYQVELEPGQSQAFSYEVVPDGGGDVSGRVILEGDEVTYDNSRYFVVRIPETRSVLLVRGRERDASEFVSYLEPALRASQMANTQLKVEERSVVDTESSEWAKHDVIVLDGLRDVPEYWFQDFQRFVQNGKGILFFPSEQGDIRNYNRFLELFKAGSYRGINGEYASFKPVEQMSNLVEGHPVIDELFAKKSDEQIQLDLPEIFFYYRYRHSGNAESFKILSTESGSPLLAEQRFGEGKVLVSAIGTDPGWSNFPVNPLFAPLYYRSVLYAASTEQGGVVEHVLGAPFEWEGPLDNQSVELVKDEHVAKPEVQGLPEGIRIRYEGYEWEPGIMEITSGVEKRLVAVNQDIMESEFVTLQHKQLENMLGNSLTVHSVIDANDLSDENLSQRLNAAGFGEEIWNWFVWVALILLVAETLISRLYKAESIS